MGFSRQDYQSWSLVPSPEGTMITSNLPQRKWSFGLCISPKVKQNLPQIYPKFISSHHLVDRNQSTSHLCLHLDYIWHPTPVLLPGKSHGRRSLVGCSPWGRGESDTTERLHFPFSLSCIGEVNGNPLQCSCLENPRDGRAWWAAVYGVTQSRTRLKRLCNSSVSIQILEPFVVLL